METLPRNIILVGFMASGKTSVGRALAERTGWTLVDADDVIVARAGKPIHRIFAEDGEPAFRELERQVIAGLCVRGAAGDSLGRRRFRQRTENRDAMLSGGRVFHLSASPADHPAAGAGGGRRGPHPTAAGGGRPGGRASRSCWPNGCLPTRRRTIPSRRTR